MNNMFEQAMSLYHKKEYEEAIKLLSLGAAEDKSEDQKFRVMLFDIYFGDAVCEESYINYKSAEKIAKEALANVKESLGQSVWYFKLFKAAYKLCDAALTSECLNKIDFKKNNKDIISCWEGFIPNEDDFEKEEQMNYLIFERMKEHNALSYYIMYSFYAINLLACDDEKKSYIEKKALQLIEEGALHNDASCTSLYSEYLITCTNNNKDIAKGFNLIKNSSEPLHNLLGWCYENGLGTSSDYAKAYQCYRNAFEHEAFLDEDSSMVHPYKAQAALHILFLSNHIQIPDDEVENYKNYLLQNSDQADYAIWAFCSRKISEINPEFLFWLANYSYTHFNQIEYLIKCYRYGIGTTKNVKKAIKLYEENDSYFRSEYLCEIGKIYYYGDELEKDIELAEKYFIESNSDNTKCFIRDSLIYLFHIYSDRKNYKYDLQKALDCLLEATKENKDNDIKLGDAFYLLGQFYQTKDYGMYNLELAKKYYEKAKEHGLNCDYAIESINRDILINKYYEEGVAEAKKEKIFREQELKDFAKKYARDKYANSTGKGLYSSVNKMLHMGINGEERIKYIENELQDDFRSVWSDLRDNAKKSLVTTTYLYSTLIEMGYEGYKDMDFSSIVNGFSKAFEIELKLFLSTGLLKFLKANKINHEEFVNEAAKQQLPFIEKEIRVEDGFPVAYYSYTEEEESKSFSLGQVRYIVTIGYENQFLNTTLDKNREKNGVRTRTAIMSGATVNEHIIDYFDELFDDDVFSSVNRKKEIANYLIDLANDVKIIQERRNPSTHEKSMTIDEAELCADYLVKSRNLMYDFLIKIKKKYRQGYFIKKTR